MGHGLQRARAAARATRARKGDAVIVHERRDTFTAGKEPPSLPCDAWVAGIVTEARGGIVTRWRPCWVADGQDYDTDVPPQATAYLLSSEAWNAALVIGTARARQWPDGQPMPWWSEAEVRAALEPCRGAAPAGLVAVTITERHRNPRTGRMEAWAAVSRDGSWTFDRIEDGSSPWEARAKDHSGFVLYGTLLAARRAAADGSALAALGRQEAARSIPGGVYDRASSLGVAL